uniref:Secreted protein n=1 Tax=Rhizophora mucronata TaxID=61149 RepID=A0A2P2NNT4_RHIMU
MPGLIFIFQSFSVSSVLLFQFPTVEHSLHLSPIVGRARGPAFNVQVELRCIFCTCLHLDNNSVTS